MTSDINIINKVTELASLLTPVSDIAVLLDIDEDELRSELEVKSSPVAKAYFKAKAETSLKLRRQEIEFAQVGSPVAIQLTASYLAEMKADEEV